MLATGMTMMEIARARGVTKDVVWRMMESLRGEPDRLCRLIEALPDAMFGLDSKYFLQKIVSFSAKRRA